MFILESQFGNDGYAFWFKLLELLANTKGHIYDINNPPDWEFLLAKTRVSEDTAKNILNTLVILGAIDTELYDKKIIWCQNFVNNLAPLYERRSDKLPQKPTPEIVSDNNNPTLEGVSDNIKPQSRVEYSKVEYIYNKNKKETGLIFKVFDDNFQRITETNREVLGDYIDNYGADEVLVALNKAVKQNKRSLAYVEGILKGVGSGKGSRGNQKTGKTIPKPGDYPEPEDM